MPDLDLHQLIDEACAPADPLRCVLCGGDSDPGVTAEYGRVCEACAHARPRLAMRLTYAAGQPLTDVWIGDLMVGQTGRVRRRWYWAALLDGMPSDLVPSLDDALDAIARAWGWDG